METTRTTQEIEKKLYDLLVLYFDNAHVYMKYIDISKDKDIVKEHEEMRPFKEMFEKDKYTFTLICNSLYRNLGECFRQIELLLYVLGKLDDFGSKDNYNKVFLFINKFGLDMGYIKIKEEKKEE